MILQVLDIPSVDLNNEPTTLTELTRMLTGLGLDDTITSYNLTADPRKSGSQLTINITLSKFLST